MPFIISRITTKTDPAKNDKVRECYVEMLERILGKSKNFVMLDLQDECPLYVRGEKGSPAAFIEVNLYGLDRGSGYEQLSKEITDLYQDTFNIPGENIFINYRDVPDFSINGDFY